MPTTTGRAPGRPQLPLDRILSTALRMVDEEGADALSLRTLAQRLGSSTATLYRHFASRTELVGRVVDRLLGEALLGDDELEGLDWEAACHRIAASAFDVLHRHRNAAPLLLEGIPTGPNAMAQREMLLSVLLSHGFAAETAARAAATIARYVLGFAIQLNGEGVTDEEGNAPAALRSADPAQLPGTASVAHFLPIHLDDEFAFGLDLLLKGLAQVRRGAQPEQ